MSSSNEYTVNVPGEAPLIPQGFSLAGYMIMAGDWVRSFEFDACELTLACEKWVQFGHKQDHLLCVCDSVGTGEDITTIYSEWDPAEHWMAWRNYYTDEQVAIKGDKKREVSCQQISINIPSEPPPAPKHFQLSQYQIVVGDNWGFPTFFRLTELLAASEQWAVRGCESQKLMCVCKTARNRYIDEINGQRFIIYSIWQKDGAWGEWLDYHSDEPFDFDESARWILLGLL